MDKKIYLSFLLAFLILGICVPSRANMCQFHLFMRVPIRVCSMNSCCGLSENLTNVCQLIWARQSLSLAKTSFNLKCNQIGSWSDTRPTHLNVPRRGEAQQQYLPLTSLSRSAINRGNLPCWCQLNHCWVLQVLQECHSVATLHTYSSNPTHLVNLPHFNQIQCLFLIFSSGGSKLL